MCKAYFKVKKEKVDLPATYFMHPFLVRNYINCAKTMEVSITSFSARSISVMNELTISLFLTLDESCRQRHVTCAEFSLLL
jgi:hypothetical protein